MAIKWTAERNERLLVLVVQELKKIDANKLAQEWAQQYGHDEFQPTPRAISEQFGALKKRAAGGGSRAKATATGISTPKTPRTKIVTTSKSGKSTKTVTPSKRKKANSDDEGSTADDEDDEEVDLKNLPKAISRASLAREKKVPKRYEESASVSSDDEVAGESKPKVAGAAAKGQEMHIAGSASSGVDSVMGEATPAKKTARKVFEFEDDESDVSDFAKSFA